MADTIGLHTAPVAERLRQAVEPTLTDEERSRIGRRIGSAFAATALLIVGTIYGKAIPDQKSVADLILFIGAVIAAFPVIMASLHGVGCSACSHLHHHGEDDEVCELDERDHKHHNGGIQDHSRGKGKAC